MISSFSQGEATSTSVACIMPCNSFTVVSYSKSLIPEGKETKYCMHTLYINSIMVLHEELFLITDSSVLVHPNYLF